MISSGVIERRIGSAIFSAEAFDLAWSVSLRFQNTSVLFERCGATRKPPTTGTEFGSDHVGPTRGRFSRTGLRCCSALWGSTTSSADSMLIAARWPTTPSGGFAVPSYGTRTGFTVHPCFRGRPVGESGEVEAVRVHHLVPCNHEVGHELLL